MRTIDSFTRARATDLLLSSGFLGFARHLGFLRAAIEADIRFDAVVGTSSGALIGALFAAGHDCERIRALFDTLRPFNYLAPSPRPWAGVCTLLPLTRVLERELPARFEELALPLAVGVACADGTHRLITEGDLPRAVTASCSIPKLCVPMVIGGERMVDGGAVDRTGVAGWRTWRPGRRAVLHRIERRFGVERSADFRDVFVVTSPSSRASLLTWRDFDRQSAESRALTEQRLRLL